MLEITALHAWFQENQREFPWREERSPYRVWVSEVMLQQTRASVVIPYFLRWMELFPDVRALAAAPLDRVIKAWEGLGYYSRARNLHAAAGQIVELFMGEISVESLPFIRGIGPYTRGAILSFGFRQRAAAVDGNVLRVMSRLFLIEEDIGKGAVRKKIEEKVEGLLDEKEPWVTGEALIELGALLCLPKPLCGDCPLQRECRAFQAGKAEALPIKSREGSVTVLHRVVVILLDGEKVLVKKGESGRVMADLYEFPYFEMEGKRGGLARLQQKVGEIFGVEATWEKALRPLSHTFTRFKAHLYPQVFLVKGREVEGFKWVSLRELSSLPFSSGHRRIMQEVAS